MDRKRLLCLARVEVPSLTRNRVFECDAVVIYQVTGILWRTATGKIIRTGTNHSPNRPNFLCYLAAIGQFPHNVVVRRQLRRRQVLPFFKNLPSCLVGVEACATSHHWSRQLRALGHTVRLMPPAYVKPYLKRRRMMPPMPKRSAKASRGPTSGSSRPRRPSSRAASCSIGRGIFLFGSRPP